MTNPPTTQTPPPGLEETPESASHPVNRDLAAEIAAMMTPLSSKQLNFERQLALLYLRPMASYFTDTAQSKDPGLLELAVVIDWLFHHAQKLGNSSLMQLVESENCSEQLQENPPAEAILHLFIALTGIEWLNTRDKKIKLRFGNIFTQYTAPTSVLDMDEVAEYQSKLTEQLDKLITNGLQRIMFYHAQRLIPDKVKALASRRDSRRPDGIPTLRVNKVPNAQQKTPTLSPPPGD